MATLSFDAIFALGFIDVYSGTQPASADDAPTGTKLVTIYSDGTATGLSWEPTAVNGTTSKLNSETWSGTVLSTGTAGWFRLREASDAGTSTSTTAARFDGSVSTSGAQMNLGSLTLTMGAPFVLTAANFTLPQS
jgi:hypothetical protein